MYDFKTVVDRTNIGNMKEAITPVELRKLHIPSFAAAEMDFKTAPSIIKSVTEMVQRGIYGFTLMTNEYKNAVKWWLSEMREWDIDADWISPALGTIYSIATAIRMTTEEGQGVIVQTPVYYRYEQAVRRLKRKIVHNRLKIADGKYKMDFEDLEAKMKNPENKLLILCNAHNPIGRVWKREELQTVAELSSKYGMTVICDEIFSEITFSGHRAVPYASIPEGQGHAITVISLGKAFNFTGVNHANVIIPDDRLRGRYNEQKYADHYGSIGPFEYASVLGAYCPEGKRWFESVRNYIEENAKFVAKFLHSNIQDAYLFPIEGTTVCWIDWSFLGMEGMQLHDFFEKEALFEIEAGDIYGPEYGRMTRVNLSSPYQLLCDALIRAQDAIENRKPYVEIV
ncbi:MAG: aminotransferase class I/II-fold pyridoxal phosphate-dependent enzyme [Dorea sp.]|nr:aminotransferase class I/II-fold pyridoxal phosphate-dependent enzyme [Dorea sp.]